MLLFQLLAAKAPASPLHNMLTSWSSVLGPRDEEIVSGRWSETLGHYVNFCPEREIDRSQQAQGGADSKSNLLEPLRPVWTVKLILLKGLIWFKWLITVLLIWLKKDSTMMKRLKTNEYVVVSCNLILYMILTPLQWKASPVLESKNIFFPDLQIFNFFLSQPQRAGSSFTTGITGLQSTVPGCKWPWDNNSDPCPVLKIPCVIHGWLAQLTGASLTSFGSWRCRIAAFLHKWPKEPSIMWVLKQNGSRAAVLVSAANIQLQKKQSIRYEMKTKTLCCYLQFLAVTDYYNWILLVFNCCYYLSLFSLECVVLSISFAPCWQTVTDA